MTLKANKRASIEPAGSSITKKPRTNATDAMNKTEGGVEMEPMQITCQLYEKFDRYPVPLRETVEKQYTDEIYHILDQHQKGKPATHMHTYHIVQAGKTAGGCSSDYKTMHAKIFPNASMANVAVLKEFLKYAPTKKSAFVPGPENKVANPEYAGLHSVIPGQMGWGFDKDGCLSLHLTKIEQNRLRHRFIYVERKSVEVVKLEDEECVIVDDLIAAKE